MSLNENNELQAMKSSERSTVALPPAKKTSKQWNERMQQRQKMLSIKTREREMKQAKEDEVERKRQVRREREVKAAEKERLEFMAAKVCTQRVFCSYTHLPTRFICNVDECKEGFKTCTQDGSHEKSGSLTFLTAFWKVLISHSVDLYHMVHILTISRDFSSSDCIILATIFTYGRKRDAVTCEDISCMSQTTYACFCALCSFHFFGMEVVFARFHKEFYLSTMGTMSLGIAKFAWDDESCRRRQLPISCMMLTLLFW